MTENKTAKGKCLLVDDSDEYLKIISKTLESWYDVMQADNGLVAWDMFLEHNFDIVVCDFVMPVMNGVELASRIRSKNKTIPIYLITGFDIIDLDEFQVEIDKLKINALISKPLTKEKLSDILGLAADS